MTVSSSPLRVAIVGCGNVALSFHLPAYDVIDFCTPQHLHRDLPLRWGSTRW